jgi:Arc/MetJ-type ribon-helix-helix transcriptional regulator
MPEEAIKCRIISFRVSDQDYEAVEEASRKGGFASVSLFARSATLALNSSELVHSPLDVEINRLWRRIEVLTTSLEQIATHQSAALESL